MVTSVGPSAAMILIKALELLGAPFPVAGLLLAETVRAGGCFPSEFGI